MINPQLRYRVHQLMVLRVTELCMDTVMNAIVDSVPFVYMTALSHHENRIGISVFSAQQIMQVQRHTVP